MEMCPFAHHSVEIFIAPDNISSRGDATAFHAGVTTNCTLDVTSVLHFERLH